MLEAMVATGARLADPAAILMLLFNENSAS